MASVDATDTFTLLSLQADPTTKVIKSTQGSSDLALDEELAHLNNFHKSMVGLDTPNGVPPPPLPVNPKRTQQINKLRDSGNAAFRKGSHQEAIKLYSLAVEMALGRPLWEPQGLVREEVSGLYANRAQAYMALREWADGLIDVELSLEAKKPQNSKAWWRKSRCLMELGRLEEANECVTRGIEFEAEADLVALKKEIEVAMEKKPLV